MKKTLITLVLILTAGSMIFAQSREDRKTAKEQERLEIFQHSKGLIESGSYSFVADWLLPQNGIRRRVLNRLAYIRISDNNAEAYLPYFGIVRTGGAHDGGGIEFNNEIKDYEESFDETNKTLTVSFKVTHKTEHYQVDMTLVKANFIKVFIHSNKRDSMEYNGVLYPFEE